MNEEIKQKIIAYNEQFGLKTEFIKDENILGYSYGDTIYINEYLEHDYERTNKHELLHFFEKTEEFEEAKKEVLEKNQDKLKELREKYGLRYYRLYTEEEINEGIIDTEIAIDLLVDNSEIEYDEGLKIEDGFLGNIQKGLEERRYLNISSISRNIEGMNLSRWEKIFVANYYDGKDRIMPQGKGKDKIIAIRQDIDTYLEKLYSLGEEEFKIDPYSTEVMREYEGIIHAGRINPQFMEGIKEEKLNEIAKIHSESLYLEYRKIIDLIRGLDLEPAFKTIMLNETLTKTYKKNVKESKIIIGKRKSEKNIEGHKVLIKSIIGHMILNETTLRYIYEHVDDMDNFADLYFKAIEKYKEKTLKESGIMLENVETFGKGKWIKFEGLETNIKEYMKNAEKLAALVQDIPWCTKTLAASQLVDGDFYVFVDNEGNPHIAVKMTGDEIDELRGIDNGAGQELEEEYREVAISFLIKNKKIGKGKEWLEKEEWNKRLIEYRRKIENGTIEQDNIANLIEDYFRNDYRSHGIENINKTKLNESLSKIKGMLAKHFNCDEEEICLSDIDFSKTNLETVPYKIIFGNANFCKSNILSLGNLQIIGENADFKNSQLKDLSNLQIIGKNANFEKSQIITLGNLQKIGGDVCFSESKIETLGNLQSIEGCASFNDSNLINLGCLKYIGRDAIFYNSKIESLGNLKKIGGDAKFYRSKVRDLGELQLIGGDAYFSCSKITDLNKMRKIGGFADFTNSIITSLGALQIIGKEAFFSESKITNLENLQVIGRSAYLAGSMINDLGDLIIVGGEINWDDKEKLQDIYEMREKEYMEQMSSSQDSFFTAQDIGKVVLGIDFQLCEEARKVLFKKIKRKERSEK